MAPKVSRKEASIKPSLTGQRGVRAHAARRRMAQSCHTFRFLTLKMMEEGVSPFLHPGSLHYYPFTRKAHAWYP